MFSARTPVELLPNRLSKLIETKRAAHAHILDLTESNPTRIGIEYPESAILQAFNDPRNLLYEPDPQGLEVARAAVADYYVARRYQVETSRIFLTASTSEAYTMLFKLLMQPGDSVLVPVPSYPLFDHLAQVECVRPSPYPLYFDGEWRIDLSALRSACTTTTRAIVIVNPNNPTGSFLKRDEVGELIAICRAHNLAIISDEVFADYAYRERDDERISSVADIAEVLTFSLSGLSKAAGLPQMKLGWIAVNGPPSLLPETHARLEFITDLFLSVGTPVQRALPRLLELAPAIQQQLHQRIASNRSWLKQSLSDACRLLPAEGGWYAILQLPRVMSEEEMVLHLLDEDDLLVHPGYFFDFPHEAWLVLSLITRPEIFSEGVTRLVQKIKDWLA